MNLLHRTEKPDPLTMGVAQDVFRLLKSADCELSGGTQRLPIRGLLLDLLKRVTSELSEGHVVAVLSEDAELTTTQAAELLNVSRPFLTKLLKDGEMAFEMRGTHHRVKLSEVLRYKQQRSEKRREGLREMNRLTEEYGLPD